MKKINSCPGAHHFHSASSMGIFCSLNMLPRAKYVSSEQVTGVNLSSRVIAVVLISAALRFVTGCVSQCSIFTPRVTQLVAASCWASLSFPEIKLTWSERVNMLTLSSSCLTGQPGPASWGHPQLDPRTWQSPWCLDSHWWSGVFPGTHKQRKKDT